MLPQAKQTSSRRHIRRSRRIAIILQRLPATQQPRTFLLPNFYICDYGVELPLVDAWPYVGTRFKSTPYLKLAGSRDQSRG
jgi:hypothetical protein